MADDIRFNVSVDSSRGLAALKNIENQIKKMQNTANSASRSFRKLTLGTTDKGLGFTKFNRDSEVVKKGIKNIGHEVSNLRRRALASQETFEKLKDTFDVESRSHFMKEVTKDIVNFERAAKRFKQIGARFGFLETAQLEANAAKRSNIMKLLSMKEIADRRAKIKKLLGMEETDPNLTRNIINHERKIAKTRLDVQNKAFDEQKRNAIKQSELVEPKLIKELKDRKKQIKEIESFERRAAAFREVKAKKYAEVVDKIRVTEVKAAKAREGNRKIVDRVVREAEAAEKRQRLLDRLTGGVSGKGDGKRQGLLGQRNQFANAALVAGGALTGLTGNFNFLGVGFAAMSGGVLGASIVGVTTALGELTRAAIRFEDGLIAIGSQTEKLGPIIGRQAELYTQAVQQLERGVLITGLGDRTGTSRFQRMRAGAKLSVNLGIEKSLEKSHEILEKIPSSFNSIPGIVKRMLDSFERMGRVAENTAMLEESNAINFQRRIKLEDVAIPIREDVDRKFKLQNQIDRIARLVAFGGIDKETGAKFLAKEKNRIFDRESFQAEFLGIDEMHRKIQLAAASRESIDEPSKADIIEMTTKIVAASKEITGAVRESMQRLIDAGGLDNITPQRMRAISTVSTVGSP